MLEEWDRRLGYTDGGERLVSVENKKGGGSRRRLKSLLGAKDMLSTKTLVKVKEEMRKAVENDADTQEKYRCEHSENRRRTKGH